METDISFDYPRSVYKFFSLEEYHKEAFLRNYLFPSHPYHLNDLMDGEFYTIDMRGISIDIYNKIKQQMFEYSPLMINKAFAKQLNPYIDKNRKILQCAIMASFFSYGGIVSLSSCNRFSELMWAHYAQENGFMIEFDTKRLLESIVGSDKNKDVYNKLYFRKIVYKQHPISISYLRNQDIEKINLFNATQKNQDWSYEKEWRIIVSSNQELGLPESVYAEDEQMTNVSRRKLYYDKSAIKRIYLGKKFWVSNIKKKEIIPNDDNNVRVYPVQSGCLAFIEELCKYIGKVYMSGSCDCSEYRHGTDTCAYNIKTRVCEYTPDYYYQTRSFELINRMEVIGANVYVIYDGIHRTKDEDFEY